MQGISPLIPTQAGILLPAGVHPRESGDGDERTIEPYPLNSLFHHSCNEASTLARYSWSCRMKWPWTSGSNMMREASAGSIVTLAAVGLYPICLAKFACGRGSSDALR